AGREIPLELSRARVESARARTQVQTLQARVDLLEETLRSDLALGEGVRLAPVESEVSVQAALADTEDGAVAAAGGTSRELKKLHTTLEAKRLAVQAEKGAHYPRIDLVAQYAMLSRYQHYEDFFKAFQRHNGQLGLSFQLPLFSGSGIKSRVAQVETEIAQLKLQLSAAIANLALETRRLFREVKQADAGRDLARMELDLARESLSVLLARFDEGH